MYLHNNSSSSNENETQLIIYIYAYIRNLYISKYRIWVHHLSIYIYLVTKKKTKILVVTNHAAQQRDKTFTIWKTKKKKKIEKAK